MKGLQVIVTDNRFDNYTQEQTILAAAGAELTVHNCRTDKELLTAAAQADGILVNLYPLTGRLIKKLPPRCRIISRYGVGYDNVDLKSATAAGIWVSIVPDYGIEEVTDHTLALLLGCIRKICFVHRGITGKQWNLQNRVSVPRTTGKVMGIIGYGRIGRALHSKLSGFPFAEVLVTDPYLDSSVISAAGAIPVNLETLCRRADFISIHACLDENSRHLIDAQALSWMKPGAILINTARGPIIDEEALVRALRAGKIAGAGLDVFEAEPLRRHNPLLKLDNVLLTSHMAYYSEESIVELKTKAACNIAEVFKGNRPLYPVNEISACCLSQGHRPQPSEQEKSPGNLHGYTTKNQLPVEV